MTPYEYPTKPSPIGTLLIKSFELSKKLPLKLLPYAIPLSLLAILLVIGVSYRILTVLVVLMPLYAYLLAIIYKEGYRASVSNKLLGHRSNLKVGFSITVKLVFLYLFLYGLDYLCASDRVFASILSPLDLVWSKFLSVETIKTAGLLLTGIMQIIIGFLIMGYLYQGQPAIIIDNDMTGLMGSIKLTYGNYWRSLALYLLAILPAITLLLFIVLTTKLRTHHYLNDYWTWGFIIVAGISIIIFSIPWFIATRLNTYHDLKLRKGEKPIGQEQVESELSEHLGEEPSTFEYFTQPASIKDVLAKSFDLYKRIFLRLAPLTILTVVFFLISFSGLSRHGWSPLTTVLILICIYFLATTYLVAYQISVSNKLFLSHNLEAGFLMAFKFILLIILWVILSFGIAAALLAPIQLGLDMWLPKELIKNIWGAVVISLYFAVPVYFFLCIPAIIIDHDKIGLPRSVELTYKNFWRTLILFLLANLTSVTFMLLLTLTVILNERSLLNEEWVGIAGLGGVIGFIVFCIPWTIAVKLNLYHDLKLRNAQKLAKK